MADNTQVTAGSGDTIRDKDRAGVKTQIVAIDLNPAGAETLMAGSMPVTGTFFQATQPVSIAASVAVTGPLTDTQLRATPVPVSGTVSTGGLTDTQLRATPVPVSGSVTTGGLTDTQLRATAVPVSAASLPLPTGAATETTVAGVRTDLGTDGTTPPAVLGSGTGVRGWLRSIYEKLTGSIAVTGTFFQATQPVSATQLPAALAAGGGMKIEGVAAGVAVPVSGTFFQAAQPVTDNAGSLTVDAPVGTPVFVRLSDGAAAIATLPVSLATNTPDVTDRAGRLLGVVTGAAAAPLALDATLTGGTQKAIARTAAKGTAVAADLTSNPVDANTQALHVNLAGTNAVNATLTAETTKVIGTVNIAAAQAVTANAGTNLNTSALALDATLTGGAQKAIVRGGAKGTAVAADITSNPVDANTQALHVNLAGTNAVNATLGAETTKVIGTVNIAAAQTLATVTTVSAVTAITNALPAGANKIGTVDIATAPATAKGTQGANAVPTQDLKDAGRNAVHFYTLIPVLTTATDTLQSLTGTKAGATVTATTTPAVVTTGKTLRITRLAATYIATATSGYGMVRLRFNTAGVVAIGSPVAATIAVGVGNPATANAADTEEALLDEGWEFAAGTGIGISVQGFAAVTATAVGYVLVSVTGYEY